MPTLSEAESKELLAAYGLAVPAEAVARSPHEAAALAEEIGYPVVAKLCGRGIAHKTERGLVKLGLRDERDVVRAATALLEAARPEDGDVSVLVSAMVDGIREFIAGVVRDPHFGACVMLGVGGVLAEALDRVVFRLLPLTEVDAEELIEDLDADRLLGPVRGEPPVDRGAMAGVLVRLADVARSEPSVSSIDVNPLLVSDGIPVAVDALVEVETVDP